MLQLWIFSACPAVFSSTCRQFFSAGLVQINWEAGLGFENDVSCLLWRLLALAQSLRRRGWAGGCGVGWGGVVGVGILFRLPVLLVRFFVDFAVRQRPTCVTVTMSFHHNCINGPLCFTGPISFFFSFALGYSSKGIQRQNRVTQQSGQAASDPGGFSGRSTPDQTESSSWVRLHVEPIRTTCFVLSRLAGFQWLDLPCLRWCSWLQRIGRQSQDCSLEQLSSCFEWVQSVL